MVHTTISALRLRWASFVVFLLAAAALPGGAILASELGDAHSVVVLQLRSFDSGWLRYFNLDQNGERRLVNADGEMLPSRRVVSAIPLGRTELENPEIVARLIYEHNLNYNIDRIDGSCDTEKLLEKDEDVICVPGSSVLPIGYIFLALYHPQTQQLVALTTTIDNSTGRANPASAQTQDVISAQDADSADAPELAARVAVETEMDGCGPYQPGQWITAEDYAASGLNLPVNTDGVGNPITDYACVLPEGGGSPYLQAYSIIIATSTERSSDDDDDDDEEEEDDDDDVPSSLANIIDC